MKVLIADDEAVSRRLLESSLSRWGYEVVVASDGVEASKLMLADNAPNLAVIDWMMPNLDGADLCQLIRRTRPEPYTYILMLTGKRAQGDVVAGLEAGADDYVTKPFDAAELKVRLRTGKRILYLQEQLISARESLRDQATHDQLTGLWNRAAVLEILNNELQRARRQNAPLGVVLADLDHFKAVNDTYGHQVGDELLRRISQTLSTAVRRYDSVGRYGGEEFLIVLPGCEQSNAMAHAERLRKAVESVTLETPTGIIRPTVSLGVSVNDEMSLRDSFDLIQAADVALYRAKNGGRNRAEFTTTSSLLAV